MLRAEHPPRQARSRETLRGGLDAAEAVMLKHGVEGTTLPRIARHARVAPATVYRRFRNKDALMRAVFRRFNERSSGAVRGSSTRTRFEESASSRSRPRSSRASSAGLPGKCRLESCRGALRREEPQA